MSAEELYRKTIVDRVLDGRKTQKEGAKALKVTERHFRRILKRYRQEGDAGLVSRKRGGSSNRKTDEETMNKIRKFICDPMVKGFGPTFMAEKLEKKVGIRISKETVRKEMIGCGVWEAKSKKKEKIHPTRPRRACRGELVQIDGSEHAWLEESEGQRQRCWYLSMTPPVKYWRQSLHLRKVSLVMETYVKVTLGHGDCR